jgi:S1-C subfamily serine protease
MLETPMQPDTGQDAAPAKRNADMLETQTPTHPGSEQDAALVKRDNSLLETPMQSGPEQDITFANRRIDMLETPMQSGPEQDVIFENRSVAGPAFESDFSPYADPPLHEYNSVIMGTPPIPPEQPPFVPPAGRQPGPPARKPFRFQIFLAIALLLVFGTGLVAGVQFFSQNGNSSILPQNTAPQNTNSQSPSTSASSTDTQREAAIQKVRTAVVEITTTTAQGEGIGSGIVIDKNGHIVTNNHVVTGAETIYVVLADGTKHKATLVGTDPADDLAVIKIDPPANLVIATLGDSSKLTVGQTVLAIGNPLGITQTVTSGIVSALNRTMSESSDGTTAGATIPNMIQTDAPINPGNSGGALIDLQGNVVGMPTLGATNTESNTQADGLGFAIPSNRISDVASQIIKDGKVTHTGRAALSVRVASVTAQVASQEKLSVDHGAYLVEVVSGGAADKAGLKVGDVIVKIDDETIEDTDMLGEVLAAHKPGDQVKMTIYRGSQQMTLTVTLGELPAGS